MTIITQKKPISLKTNDVLAFIIGVLSFVQIQVVGELYVSEIALAILIPLLWRKKSHLLRGVWIKRILFFGLLWFISQVITDIIRSTPVPDLLRGWAAILVFIVDFASLYMLLSQNTRRIMIYVLGTALGGLMQPFFQPSIYFKAYPWEFGFGYPAILLTIVVITFLCANSLWKIKAWMLLPLTALGLFSIYLGARSLGAFAILAAFLLWLRGLRLGRLLVTRLSIGKIVAAGIILLMVVFGIYEAYGYAAGRGWLGENAILKFKMQSGGAFGILVGGRADIIPALYAISDSPFIGHGSWAKDPKYRLYYLKLLDWGYENNKVYLQSMVEASDLIPSHSHILQAWVWAGVIGAIFWMVILWLVLKSILHNFRFPNPLSALVIFFGLQSVWDILFSPFGSMMRLEWMMRLVVFICALLLITARRKENV